MRREIDGAGPCRRGVCCRVVVLVRVWLQGAVGIESAEYHRRSHSRHSLM
jgi:hypothetical protein